MKKLILIIFFVFFTQKTFAQLAQYTTLYLLFEPENTQSLARQGKVMNSPVQNPDGTWRKEDKYGYSAKYVNGYPHIEGFYDRLYITIDRNNFITVPLSELSNYPVRTIDQVRQEANPTNAYMFSNYDYYKPIKHYYIVEKNVNAGTAKIVKVFVREEDTF